MIDKQAGHKSFSDAAECQACITMLRAGHMRDDAAAAGLAYACRQHRHLSIL